MRASGFDPAIHFSIINNELNFTFGKKFKWVR